MDDNTQDFAYSSDDSQDQVLHYPNLNMLADYDAQINDTADSLKQNFENEGNQNYNQASLLFSKFYYQQLIRSPEDHNQIVKKFIQHKLFDSYRKSIKIYPPIPNLYFLPTTIIIEKKSQNFLIPLRDAIVYYFGNKANVKTPNERPQQILVTIHDDRQMSFFIIRFSITASKYKHNMPQLFDADLSIDPLLQFYMKYQNDFLKISQTCGIFLYWAYQKKLLSPDYISQSAIKLIVIYFYFSVGYGLPNIITTYINKKHKQLDQLKKMYRVNKKLQCQLQPQIFNFSNFSLREKRSFYIESQQKYSTMINILPVPYPVTPQQQQQFIKLTNIKQKQKLLSKDRKIYPVLTFLKMMQFLQNNIKRSQRIIFDFVKDRKGISEISDLDFNIEIKHPIFGHNICSTLTNDVSKIKILKDQISKVVKIFNTYNANKTIQALSKIFQKS